MFRGDVQNIYKFLKLLDNLLQLPVSSGNNYGEEGPVFVQTNRSKRLNVIFPPCKDSGNLVHHSNFIPNKHRNCVPLHSEFVIVAVENQGNNIKISI